MKATTIQQFFKRFSSDDVCLKHLFDVRFGQNHNCLKCLKDSKWYPIKAERAFSCGNCGHHLHPTVGTIFEDSKTSLQLWFYAIYLFTTTRSGVSAKELQRQLGITYKCAWRMGHKIREHMAEVDGDDKLGGVVEVDETYIGGKRKGKRGRGASGKTIVFGMLQKNGDVMTKIVNDVKAKTLQTIIEANVEQKSEIQSDELLSYRGIDKRGFTHSKVNHGSGQYVSKSGSTVKFY
jgi:transposase